MLYFEMEFCFFDFLNRELLVLMHTNHFGNISKFLEIDGQLLEIGWSSIDVLRMHEFIHRNFSVCFISVLILLTFGARYFNDSHRSMHTRVELSIGRNVKLTCYRRIEMSKFAGSIIAAFKIENRIGPASRSWLC